MVTIDTNIAFYALARDGKAGRARQILATTDFLSVQVINEYAFAARRKLGRTWRDIADDIALLRGAVPTIHAIAAARNADALSLAERYQLSFFDALLIAVAIANSATRIYSEDLHHGLVVDECLTIVNPFLPEAAV